MDIEALQRLDRILNNSSNEPELLKKKKLEISSSSLSSSASSSSNNNDLLSILYMKPPPWIKYFDTVSLKYYYHNHETNITQWEVPNDYTEVIEPTPPTTENSSIYNSSSSASCNEYPSQSEYKSAASFTTTNGVFNNAGTGSYWDKVNRPNDKGGRQMSAFFDINELERNREEAKLKKEQLQHSHIDWKKYKLDKQNLKKKKRSEWLLND